MWIMPSMSADSPKQPKLGDIADFAFDLGANLMVVDELLPRIALHLLQAQRDAALGGVHIQHHDLHLLAGGDDLAGMHVLLGPGHLADVHQALDARLQLDEGTVVGDVGDASGVLGTDRVFCRNTLPRIGLELLHAE